MKIEKINDNQIRCTLTQEDLANRQLKLSELAYGTEKAKMLFHDMMQQANYEFGFESEDIPLMIEAVPISPETIVLIITKVEYPEELDTRFSKFSDTPEGYDSYSNEAMQEAFAESADGILGLFRKIAEENDIISSAEADGEDSSGTSAAKEHIQVPLDLTKLFAFHNLEDIIKLAHILQGFYEGDNTIFKDEQAHMYYLVLHKSKLSPEVFNKVCNILAEYGNQRAVSDATEAYFLEHHTILCQHHALQSLALL